ncbi:MAG: hypothetical protein KDD70_16145, partial [Bdellovibrionales bacterium]|nr:hypothetical protein [Bdellovibrionales bacterium]
MNNRDGGITPGGQDDRKRDVPDFLPPELSEAKLSIFPGEGRHPLETISNLTLMARRDTNHAFVVAQHLAVAHALKGLMFSDQAELAEHVKNLFQGLEQGGSFAIAGSERGRSSRKPQTELVVGGRGELLIEGRKDYVTGTPPDRRHLVTLASVISIDVDSHRALIEHWESEQRIPKDWKILGNGKLNALALVPADREELIWRQKWSSPAFYNTDTHDIEFRSVPVAPELLLPFAPWGKWVEGSRYTAAIGMSFLLATFVGGIEQAASLVRDAKNEQISSGNLVLGERIQEQLYHAHRAMGRLANKLTHCYDGLGRQDDCNELLAHTLATKIVIEQVAKNFFRDLKEAAGELFSDEL